MIEVLHEGVGQKFWKEGVESGNIPGSARVPVQELKGFLKQQRGVVNGNILDLGSGLGRSTEILRDNFPDRKIIAMDLNWGGLRRTLVGDGGKVQASAEMVPLKKGSIDAIVVCGLMTNLVHQNPLSARDLRCGVVAEMARVLPAKGLVAVSDFARPHRLSGYPVNYKRHKLITGEYGTIAVFASEKKLSFYGLSDEEVSRLSDSPFLERFAHHYDKDELIGIFEQNSFRLMSFEVELGCTPTGTPIDSFVSVFEKL